VAKELMVLKSLLETTYVEQSLIQVLVNGKLSNAEQKANS